MDTQEINLQPLRRVLSEMKSDNDIQKSLIEDISYNKDLLTISKTGKDFKALLTKLKGTLEAECQEYKAKLTILQSLIVACGGSNEPKDELSSYQYGGLRKSAFPYIPKVYSYEQRYPNERGKESYDGMPQPVETSYESSDLHKMGNAPTVDEKKQCAQHMDTYNECARKYISRVADKLFIEGLVSSVGDKASVKLSGQMLKLLV